MTEVHPTILHVSEARKEGIKGNYDACLTEYSLAKNEADAEASMCRNFQEKEKWINLVNEIVQEMYIIRKIKLSTNDISKLINQDTLYKMCNSSSDNDSFSHNDDMVLAPMRRALANEERRHQPRKKRNSFPAKSAIGKPPKIAIKPYAELRQPLSQKRANIIQNKKTRLEKENPLVRQIMDMGILEKKLNVHWDSIAGLADVKKLLRNNLVILPKRPDICKGLLSPWRSVLLYGPPGTGKTFLAKAVASECNRTFFNITSSVIMSRFLGESEKLVSALFQIAEDMSPSTIFFDEVDSLVSQRGGKGEHEASRRLKSQLLTKLEGIDGLSEDDNVFVMAATNFPWDLDEALLRRFQKRIYIPLPDAEGRKTILTSTIGDLIAKNFEMDKFVSLLDGYSCADISNLCRDVAQAVFGRRAEALNTIEWINMSTEDAKFIITNEDFENGLKKRKSSVDKATIEKYEQWRQQKGAE